MFYVYGVYNREEDQIYVGQTNDLKRRILEHNSKVFDKGHWTSRFSGGWQLIYSEKLASRKEAILREKQLKSHQGRKFLRSFIKKIN